MRILLVLVLACLGFKIKAEDAHSSAGMQAVRYYYAIAQQTAERIKNARGFSESKFDTYEFYHTFISYKGYEHLSSELLGSWEFADRIENLVPYWSPVNHERIEAARQAARAARRQTDVRYSLKLKSALNKAHPNRKLGVKPCDLDLITDKI